MNIINSLCVNCSAGIAVFCTAESVYIAAASDMLL